MFDIFSHIKSTGQELSAQLLRRDLSGPYSWSPNKIFDYTQTHHGPHVLKANLSGSSYATKPAFQLFCALKVQPHVESLLANKGLSTCCALSLHGGTNAPFLLPGQLFAHAFPGASESPENLWHWHNLSFHD